MPAFAGFVLNFAFKRHFRASGYFPGFVFFLPTVWLSGGAERRPLEPVLGGVP
jgi:hypothetical protein